MNNDLALAVEIQVEAQKAIEQIHRVNESVKGMGEEFQTAGGAGSSAGDSIFAGMFKAQLAMEGLRMAIRAVTEVFKGLLETGMEFNAAMSGSALGIGVLITTMTTLRDANGQVLTGQNALNAGMALGADQVDKLRIGSFKTVATVMQLTDAYQQALGPMLGAGVKLEDTTKLTILFAQAAGALHLPMETLGHDMAATFSGQWSQRITRVVARLQISKEQIESWRQLGTLTENLTKRMEVMGLAGDMTAASWLGVTSNLKHAMEAGSGEMVKPLFEALRVGLGSALGDAFDLATGEFSKKFKPILDVGAEVFGELGKMAQGALRWAVSAAEDLAGWFRENRKAVYEITATLAQIAIQIGGIIKDVFSLAGGVSDATGGFSILKAITEGIGLGVALIRDGLRLVMAGALDLGTTLLAVLLSPIQALLLALGEASNFVNKGSGDALVEASNNMQIMIDKGHAAAKAISDPVLNGKSAVGQFADALLDAQVKAENLGKAVKNAVGGKPTATGHDHAEKPDAESARLRALEMANALLADQIKAHATLTLDDQEEVALMKVKLETDKERASIMKANEAHDDPNGGKKIKGISDSDAEARTKSALDAQVAQETKIHTEFSEKRRLMAEALQNALTAGEEGGMAKRLAVLEIGFEKERKQNAELGNLHSAAEMKASQDAAIERARQEEITAQVGKLKKALAEMVQINGGPLTSGELSAAVDKFAAKNLEAAAAAQKVRDELHLGQGAAAGFEAAMREALTRGGTAFTLMKTAATSALQGVASSFSTLFTSILTQAGSFGDKMKALWKGISQAVVGALGQMATQYLINKAIQAGLTTVDTTVVNAEGAKAKAIMSTGAAAKLSGAAQTTALATVATAAPIAVTAVNIAAGDMTVAYGAIAKAAMIAGAAEAWEAYGGIPVYGAIAAAAQITAMNLSIAAEAAIPAYANGGRVDRATIGLMAEKGPEIITPESSFHDYSKTMFAMGANLAGNLGANNRQAQNYRGASAGYGAQVASNGPSGPGGQGGLNVDLRGAVIAGESAESSRLIGNMVKKHLDLYYKRAG